MMRTVLLILFLSGGVVSLSAQYISLVRSVWDDRLTEWELIDEETGEQGTVHLRWTYPLDWGVWDIRWGDTTAEFSLAWKDDPEQWDLIMGNRRISARTRWPGDLSEWLIRYEGEVIVWRPADRYNPDLWETEDLRRVPFRMYTLYERDIRDWVIEDEMREDAFPLRLMLIMLTVYHSIPRN